MKRRVIKKRRGRWPIQHLVAMKKNCSWTIWRTDLDKLQSAARFLKKVMYLPLMWCVKHAGHSCSTNTAQNVTFWNQDSRGYSTEIKPARKLDGYEIYVYQCTAFVGVYLVLTCSGSAIADQWWRTAKSSLCWVYPVPLAWEQNRVSWFPELHSTPAHPPNLAHYLH